RSDLYFRLKVVSIPLPPLRDRGEDILLLGRHFVRDFARKFQKPFDDMSPEAMEALTSYAWPGNVRELRNLMERVVLLEDGPLVRLEHLPSELLGRGSGIPVSTAESRAFGVSTLAQLEAEHIAQVLRLTEGNKSQ